MRNGARQVAINLSGGVNCCTTIIAGLGKHGVANVLNLNPKNQHYTAFLVIDETDTDRTCGCCCTDRDNPKRSE